MIRAFLIAALLSITALAEAQPLTPPTEVAADIVKVDRYPAHSVTFPNGVKGIPGMVYWEPVGYRPLTLDLYLPPSTVSRPAAGFPLVLYLHGGGWMTGDTHRSGPFVDFPGVLAALAGRGYVVAAIQYRLSGEAKFPAQAQDAKAAIRWLRLHASEYGIDPDKALTWGMSAGGHLAGLTAVSCNAAGLEPKQPHKSFLPDTKSDPITSSHVSDCVQGGVSWYGVFNMATITAQSRQDKAMTRDVPDAPEWRLLGCYGSACGEQTIAAASPVTYVDRTDPPMLLIVGSEDTAVPYSQTLEMADKLKAAGVKHELIILPGVNHGFIGNTPDQTREANLKALEATFRFIDKTAGKSIATQPPLESTQTGPPEPPPVPEAIQPEPSELPNGPESIQEGPSAGLKIIDVLLVRPLCVIGSTVSTAVYVAISPLVFVMGVAEPAARVMVEAPWRFTAFRYIGEFNHYTDEQPIMGVWDFS